MAVVYWNTEDLANDMAKWREQSFRLFFITWYHSSTFANIPYSPIKFQNPLIWETETLQESFFTMITGGSKPVK